ncbi:uncharacterized protein [Spinacia oleracea]|uniref:Ubiquitin-like protease family profile domain-containing protein n=1 Tax=Spinacia oleracea TaxID=3562 RepID=A0ABM3REJ2_SPIOL|nr:uncharacterized protein LOC110799681 [Spinacia oleracea]
MDNFVDDKMVLHPSVREPMLYLLNSSTDKDKYFYYRDVECVNCTAKHASSVLKGGEMDPEFIDAYMLDMFEREWSHRVSTRNRLYLPTYFHNLISISVGDDISSPSRRIKCSDSLIWYSRGNELDEINQVYIPLFEQDHWFLVVIDLAAQVKYIVGSIAVNAQCEKRVLKLLNRCSKKYMNDKDK